MRECNRLRPRFVLISGDLANQRPGADGVDGRARREQVADLKQVLSGLDEDIPLVLQPGNHDVGDAPTAASLASYTAAFGDDYFSFWIGDLLFACLNSAFYTNS